MHNKCLLHIFSGSLIYSAGQVINNSVVLSEIEFPVIINLSLEVSQVKNWENPTKPTKILHLLDSHQCHISIIKVFGQILQRIWRANPPIIRLVTYLLEESDAVEKTMTLEKNAKPNTHISGFKILRWY